MSFVARKIARAKWDSREGVGDNEIPADAVTNDLRTSANALSFWNCGAAQKDDLERVVLALASGAERLDKIDLAWIPITEIEKARLVIEQTDGQTPVAILIKEHVDVSRLDFVRLGKVAALLADAIEEDRYKRVRKKQVTDVIIDARKRGLLSLTDLSEKVRDEVKKAMAEQ